MKRIAALGAVSAVMILSACGGSSPPPDSSAPVSLIPYRFRPLGPVPLHGTPAPRATRTRGIYVSEFFGGTVLGYLRNDRGNGPPKCSVSASYPNDVVTDGSGNLIDPDGGTRNIIYFGGPKMCGPMVASVADPYGEPSDAARVSGNALNQQIAVATSGVQGSIALCGPQQGCTADLTNPAMDAVAGVAMARGDCWGSATTYNSAAALFFFKHCSGSGRVATGYQNASYGGLDFDRHGNLISVSSLDAKLYVYKGCDPKCTLIGGPFSLAGLTLFGHLNAKSTEFFAADFEFGQVDVYRYGPTSLTYEYSFNNGLSASDDVEGVAVNPE